MYPFPVMVPGAGVVSAAGIVSGRLYVFGCLGFVPGGFTCPGDGSGFPGPVVNDPGRVWFSVPGVVTGFDIV